jgi:hypothetical protein
MMEMKSRRGEKEERFVEGVPAGEAKGTMEVGAEMVRFEPSGWARSCWRKERKFEVSSGLRRLHSRPCLFGNSQL